VLPGQKYSPDDIVRILLHRKWIVVPLAALGIVGGVFVSHRIPPKYKSETLIMVVPQRIPDTYVKSTITSKIEDRLPSISDQILSRSRLERIIRDLDPLGSQRNPSIMEDAVQEMRGNIQVKLEGKESFRVSYVNRDPKMAQRVTERLASLYIEESLRDRGNQAESTNQFLEAQLEDAKRRLVEHENKLKDYRLRYAGELPTQVASNLQVIQNAQLQLQSLAEAVNRERERRLLLERQLADAQTPDPIAVVVQTPGAPGEASAEPLPQQLEGARTRLALLQTRYTEEHPDVVAMKKAVQDLETKVKLEAARPAASGASDKPMTLAESVRQKKMRDLKAQIEDVDRQLEDKKKEEQRLQGVIAKYQANVDVVPTRESELVDLQRDYATLQTTYASLLAKREDSKLAADLEQRQIGEQFKVLDQASLPEKPSNSTQRTAALGGGAFGGLFLGLLIAAFLEYRDATFKSDSDVQRLLNLPVLALVPMMASDFERRAHRRRKLLSTLAVAIVVLGSLAAVMVWRMQS
jgi:polysaccharide chain length determinant protein (PEP-CTERM system associated)